MKTSILSILVAVGLIGSARSDSLVTEYKKQIKLFDPVDMAANVLKVYKAVGF